MALMTAGSSIPSMPMLTRGSAPEVLMSDNREILPPLAPAHPDYQKHDRCC
jgi:hypothetical protein